MPVPGACSFRQIEEKHVSSEVSRMVWSPRMDLLAVANVQGEVVLHRLSWQKVWTVAPPGEDAKVVALAWRPDGKVLAVSYTSGKVVLCDVENASCLHSLQMASSITSMTWVTEVKHEGDDPDSTKDIFVDNSEMFLPKLPPFPKSYTAIGKGQSEENMEDAKKLKGQVDLNLLVIGLEDGQLHLYAYGVFPTGVVDLSLHGDVKTGEILCAHLSEDLRMLSMLVKAERDDGDTHDVNLISFDTTLLAERHKELRIMALKFGQILTLMMYLDSSIQQMKEAWEDILLEMDSKLMKFAEEKQKISSGTVSNDFLRLLMFGTPSEELQKFLLNELTDKGLKKLGLSIETSYSNIQKLVLKHLQSVGQALVYHLADVQGMAQMYSKFGVLGISPDSLQTAISAAGSFMLKASELQQVIDGSIKNFKAFFRWLYVVMKGLAEEPVPPELTKMTQQDLNFVAQFLKENFTEEVEGSKSGFKLEKVGQYLKNEDLSDAPDTSGNPWVMFLEQNISLKESPLLYTAQPTKSLIQMHEQLKSSIDLALDKCAVVIGETLQCISTKCLFILPEEKGQLRLSQFSKKCGSNTFLYTIFMTEAPPCEQCYIMRQTTDGTRYCEVTAVKFGEIGMQDADESLDNDRCREHTILDIAFYNPDTVSVLLQEVDSDDVPVLIQLPMQPLEDNHFKPLPNIDVDDVSIFLDNMVSVDAGGMIDSLNYRRLENMKAAQFAVSGTRNAACVLFSSRRRVRVFLMDVEDEDEDEEEEDEDEDEDEDADTSQNRTGDASNGIGQDDDEDKENSRESAMDL